MNIFNYDGESALVEVGYDELYTLKNCLNEAALLVPENEFELRVDATKDEVNILLESFYNLVVEMRKLQNRDAKIS